MTSRPSPHCLLYSHEWKAGGIALAGTWFNTSTEDRPDMHSSQSGGSTDPGEGEVTCSPLSGPQWPAGMARYADREDTIRASRAVSYKR